VESTSSELNQVVHSPEQYRIELPLAGPTSRILAYAIDYGLIFVLSMLLFIVALAYTSVAQQISEQVKELVEASQSGNPNALAESNALLMLLGLVIIAQLITEWGYFIFCEMTMNGRSPGKAALKLRVVGDGGHPLSFGQSVARNLLRAVDVLPMFYIVGMVAMVISPEAKRLGDMAAGTVVIRLDRPARAAPVDALVEGNPEMFRVDHEQAARIGPDELRLARQTLRRLPELVPDQAELALARTVDVLVARLEHEPVPAEHRKSFLHALIRTAERR
jgi:uncharacterized RDD family membrane protein YckC